MNPLKMNPEELAERIKTATENANRGQCLFARFVESKHYVAVDRHTRQPRIALKLKEIALWEPENETEAIRFVKWANNFVNQIELVWGEMIINAIEAPVHQKKIETRIID